MRPDSGFVQSRVAAIQGRAGAPTTSAALSARSAAATSQVIHRYCVLVFACLRQFTFSCFLSRCGTRGPKVWVHGRFRGISDLAVQERASRCAGTVALHSAPTLAVDGHVLPLSLLPRTLVLLQSGAPRPAPSPSPAVCSRVSRASRYAMPCPVDVCSALRSSTVSFSRTAEGRSSFDSQSSGWS